MTHELKTWPEYFNILMDGSKEFELRKNDRDFKVFDTLHLREYDPSSQEYTGRVMVAVVTYCLYGSGLWGLDHGYVIMSIKIIGR